jgi:hypothetical protein
MIVMDGGDNDDDEVDNLHSFHFNSTKKDNFVYTS